MSSCFRLSFKVKTLLILSSRNYNKHTADLATFSLFLVCAGQADPPEHDGAAPTAEHSSAYGEHHTQVGTCPNGSFILETCHTSCQKCSCGFYSKGHSTVCTACVAGTAAGPSYPRSLAFSLSLCNAPTLTRSLVQSLRVPRSTSASPRMSSPLSRRDPPSLCSLDTIPQPLNLAAPGASTCTVCPRGEFATGPGQCTCKKCPCGHYSSKSGTTACTKCPSGKFAGAGAQACQPCHHGHYAPTPGACACPSCPCGSYAAFQGTKRCQKCEPGQYSSAVGATAAAVCQCCMPHLYSYGGECACFPWPFPKKCPCGHYLQYEDSSTCTACPPNTYRVDNGDGVDSGGQITCQPCPRGETSGAGACQCSG